MLFIEKMFYSAIIDKLLKRTRLINIQDYEEGMTLLDHAAHENNLMGATIRDGQHNTNTWLDWV